MLKCAISWEYSADSNRYDNGKHEIVFLVENYLNKMDTLPYHKFLPSLVSHCAQHGTVSNKFRYIPIRKECTIQEQDSQ
jgi:hypothetical protein